MFLYRLVSFTENLCLSCHCHTLLPFTCADDSCVSLWHARGSDPPYRLLNEAFFEGLHFSVLLVVVHICSAGREASTKCGSVFADLALYLAVCGLCLGPVLSCSLSLVLQARLAPIPRLPILSLWSFSRSLSLSLKLVCSRSATLNLATALLSARGRASTIFGTLL